MKKPKGRRKPTNKEMGMNIIIKRTTMIKFEALKIENEEHCYAFERIVDELYKEL